MTLIEAALCKKVMMCSSWLIWTRVVKCQIFYMEQIPKPTFPPYNFFRDIHKSKRSFTTPIYTYMSSLYRPRPLLGVQAGWGSQASHRETSPQSPEISLSCIWARRQRQRQSSTWFNIWLKWYEHRPRSAWLQCAFASRSSSPCDTQNYNTRCFQFILNFHILTSSQASKLR